MNGIRVQSCCIQEQVSLFLWGDNDDEDHHHHMEMTYTALGSSCCRGATNDHYFCHCSLGGQLLQQLTPFNCAVNYFKACVIIPCKLPYSLCMHTFQERDSNIIIQNRTLHPLSINVFLFFIFFYGQPHIQIYN